MKAPILCIVACVTAIAADNALTSAEKQAGFRLLFDGHTFANWRDPAAKGTPRAAWAIEDGCLRTTARPHITEDLITRESFGNFELKCDWRISDHGNTGVKYRIQRNV